MEKPVLEVKKLFVNYHTREGVLPALRNINFSVNSGEIVGIVGESGCGKSSVAYSVMGLLPPNAEIESGSVIFRGEEITCGQNSRIEQLWGNEFSMIFQDPMTSLNPVFSVEDQLMTALRAQSGKSGSDRKEMRGRMLEMLEKVGIPDFEKRIKEFPHQFSGGMRQRIMIAMALLSKPSMLIADEPTSALDVTLEAQINDLISDLSRELGTSVLYITHDLGVIAQICDRVIVMYAGNVVESGNVHRIFANPQHPYTRALLRSHPSRVSRSERLVTIPGRVPSLLELPAGCKYEPRCDIALTKCQECEPDEVAVKENIVSCHNYKHLVANDGSGVTEPCDNSRQPEDSEKKEVVVSAKVLKVHFNEKLSLADRLTGKKQVVIRAVDGVDLSVERGRILALVGESGSGKTTLGRGVLRLTPVTGGEVLMNGRDISTLSSKQIRPMRSKMQMIFQDPVSSLSPRMKVSSLLLEPFDINKIMVKDPEAKVAELLNMVGLSMEQAGKYPHQLSGGQARRVSIARALALYPSILVADEPTAGLDVSVAAGILNLLKDLREKLNITFIIITHNLNIISYTADQVAVMYLGRIIETAETDQLFSCPRHPYTEALLSAVSIPDPTLRGKHSRITLTGEIPSPRKMPEGCSFHTRCRYAQDSCKKVRPELRGKGPRTHLTACHFPLDKTAVAGKLV